MGGLGADGYDQLPRNLNHELWSMNSVFDRGADRRVIKSTTIVDSATQESMMTVLEGVIWGLAVTHMLDRLAMTHDLLRIVQTDSRKNFSAREMLT